MNRYRSAFTSAILLVILPARSFAQYAEVIDLGSLGNSPQATTPHSINNHSQVVGLSSTNTPDSDGTNKLTVGFLWTRAAGITSLAPDFDVHYSDANGINNAGNIAGWINIQHLDALGFIVPEPTLRHPDGSYELLGTLGAPFTNAVAAALNDHDQVVGWSNLSPGTFFPMHAFIWNRATGMTDLGQLHPQDDRISAAAINNRGMVVGGEGSFNSSFSEAFLWDSTHGMRGLGTLPGPQFGSGAVGINDNGVIVGTSDTTAYFLGFPYLTDHAVIWDASDLRIHDLGTLPDGFWSEGKAINSLGEVAGLSYTPVNGYSASHAVIYTHRHWVDLNDLIDPSSGWELQTALGLNNKGEVIGLGTLNGNPRAFYLKRQPSP